MIGVSCYCISHFRSIYLERAIICFLNQSYPNKQLIILYSVDDSATRNLLSSYTSIDLIKSIPISNYNFHTLGSLRNQAIENCDFDFVCQWDDDDWHHYDRVQIQLSACIKHGCNSSMLEKWLLFDEIDRNVHMSGIGPWGGSILFHKENCIKKYGLYADRNFSEDEEYMLRIFKNIDIVILSAPQLYIYIFHGGNITGHRHFSELKEKGSRLSENVFKDIQRQLTEKNEYVKLAHYLDQLLTS